MFRHLLSTLYRQPLAIMDSAFDTIHAQFEAYTEGKFSLEPTLPRPQLAQAIKLLSPHQSSRRTTLPGFTAGWDPNDPQRPENEEAPPLYEYNRMLGIGLLRVWGVLGKHLSWMDTLCGGVDCATLDRALCSLANPSNTPGMKALIIDFRSPGGSVAGIRETAAEIAEFSKEANRGYDIPVYAYTEDVCASAAYWLATACTAGIAAAPSATVGSIGVICAAIDRSAQYEALGMKVERFRSGPYKGMNMMNMGLSDEEKAHIQNDVLASFADFQSHILTTRPDIDPEAFKGAATYAIHAPSGMVDSAEVPSLEDFIDIISTQPHPR